MPTGPYECGLNGVALGALLLLHAVGAVAVLASQLPAPVVLALLLIIGASAWQAPKGGGRVHFDGRHWWWQRGDGAPVGPLSLARGGFRSRSLVVVRLQGGGVRRCAIVHRAGHCPQQWRSLGVLLH